MFQVFPPVLFIEHILRSFDVQKPPWGSPSKPYMTSLTTLGRDVFFEQDVFFRVLQVPQIIKSYFRIRFGPKEQIAQRIRHIQRLRPSAGVPIRPSSAQDMYLPGE